MKKTNVKEEEKIVVFSRLLISIDKSVQNVKVKEDRWTMKKYLFPVTHAACRGKLPQTSEVCFAPCDNNISAISNLVVVEVIDDDQKCFSPSKVVVRKCFAPWDNNIANISNNSLIMWMIIGSIDCAGDQIITFIVPNRHYLMSWFNTTSVQPVLLLCCYTVMLLFCYAVI